METNNKLREALEDVLEKIDRWRTDGSMEHWQYRQLFDIADAALAEPVRNCEVGTPEEQAERLHAYCKSHRCLYCSSGDGDECKFYRPGMKMDCKIEWANAPYEEGGAK